MLLSFTSLFNNTNNAGIVDKEFFSKKFLLSCILNMKYFRFYSNISLHLNTFAYVLFFSEK